MCMVNCKTNFKFLRSKKAYKVMRISIHADPTIERNWVTPYQGKPIDDNEIIADGFPSFYQDVEGYRSFKILAAGAIHCYRDLELALFMARILMSNRYISNVIYRVFTIYGDRIIAYNDTEIAFNRISFVDYYPRIDVIGFSLVPTTYLKEKLPWKVK